MRVTANRQCRLFLRHSGLAQTGKEDAFEAIADSRRVQISVGPNAGDGRIAVGSDQPLCLGELGRGAVQLAFEAIGAGEEVAWGTNPGISVARLFEPRDRLVDARLKHMNKADREVSVGNQGIAGAEADGLLGKLDRLFARAAGQKLAPAETGKRADRVAIDGEHHFVFGNRVLASALRAEQPGLGLVSERVLGGYCQGLVD